MSSCVSVNDAIKEIQHWLRLATFLHHPLKNALLYVLHNKGNRTDYVGLPENEIDLFNELTRQMGIINKLVKKKVLSKAQVDILLPPGTNKTDSSLFDVTLIIVLIINCTTLPSPTNGWWGEVDLNDLSTAAFVLHARKWRNILIHATEPRSLCKADFDRIWADGESIVNGLGLTTVDTKKLKNINLDVRNSIILNSVLLYLNKIQGKMDTHDKELAQLQGDITNVNIELFNNREDIETLTEQNKEFKQQIDHFKQQIEAIQKELDAKNKEKARFDESQGNFVHIVNKIKLHKCMI